MIPKKHRISKGFFEEIYKNGKGFSSLFLSMKVLKNNDKINFFSVVVSKKVSKVAPKRNKIKRRILYVLKQQNKLMKQGYFIVLQVKPPMKDQSYSFFKEEVLKILKKSDILA